MRLSGPRRLSCSSVEDRGVTRPAPARTRGCANGRCSKGVAGSAAKALLFGAGWERGLAQAVEFVRRAHLGRTTRRAGGRGRDFRGEEGGSYLWRAARWRGLGRCGMDGERGLSEWEGGTLEDPVGAVRALGREMRDFWGGRGNLMYGWGQGRKRHGEASRSPGEARGPTRDGARDSCRVRTGEVSRRTSAGRAADS